MILGETVLVLGVSLFVVSSAWQMVLIPRSRRYRTDVPANARRGAGSSPFWQVNVYHPRNYQSEDGRRFHRKLAIAVLIQVVGMLLFMTGGVMLM